MKYRVQASRRKINSKTNLIIGVSIVIVAILIARLAYLSIYKYDEYQQKNVDQSIDVITIKAERGTIYDRNRNILAVSVYLDRVFVDPYAIDHILDSEEKLHHGEATVKDHIDKYVNALRNGIDEKERIKADMYAQFEDLSITVKEDIANEMAKIFGVDKQTVLDKENKIQRRDETIKDEVDKETANLVRELIERKCYENYIYVKKSGKRMYPHGSLAAHVVGFMNAENVGTKGVEAQYDSILSGIDGRIITTVDGANEPMPNKYESHIEGENGKNVVLTLDTNIQRMLEKNLETCYAETRAENGVMGIVLDVNNFEILGMATLPTFDLNHYLTLDEASQAKYEAYDQLPPELITESINTKEKYRSQLVQEMWRNRFISDTYEPGSTFKMISASAAVEEKVSFSSDDLSCDGRTYVEGYSKPINCHFTDGHGRQTLEEALWHSCNPAFVSVGLKLGTERFYKYFTGFGYTEKTGVDLPGEINGMWHSTFNQVELAVSSFGQTFTVTPIQHITAVAAVANGGFVGTPHVLKSVLDDDGKIVLSYDNKMKRQVISSETSKTIVEYMANGIDNGSSARNAYVKGYKVAAKTGTTVKTALRTATGETKYISSCVAFAPAEDPKVAVMVLVDEPVGVYYGGTVAAPVVSRILADVLPYLGVEPKYDEEELETVAYNVENYVNNTVSDAKAKIVKADYEYKVIGSGLSVVRQVPKAGETLAKGGTIVLYTDDVTSGKTLVPDVIGLTASAANRAIVNAGLNITIDGASPDHLEGAVAVSQSIEPNLAVDKGTVIVVDFRNYSNITD